MDMSFLSNFKILTFESWLSIKWNSYKDIDLNFKASVHSSLFDKEFVNVWEWLLVIFLQAIKKVSKRIPKRIVKDFLTHFCFDLVSVKCMLFG